MLSIETIAVLIIGYLIGSIPWAVIIAKRSGVDIFTVGSGNPGATNVLRTLGKSKGYLVFFLDFCKGLLAVWWFHLPLFSFSGDVSLGLWSLPAAVIGHTYPIFTGFRAGRGNGHGRITRFDACLFTGGIICLGPYLLSDQICCGCIHCIWIEFASLYPCFL